MHTSHLRAWMRLASVTMSPLPMLMNTDLCSKHSALSHALSPSHTQCKPHPPWQCSAAACLRSEGLWSEGYLGGYCTHSHWQPGASAAHPAGSCGQCRPVHCRKRCVSAPILPSQLPCTAQPLQGEQQSVSLMAVPQPLSFTSPPNLPHSQNPNTQRGKCSTHLVVPPPGGKRDGIARDQMALLQDPPLMLPHFPVNREQVSLSSQYLSQDILPHLLTKTANLAGEGEGGRRGDRGHHYIHSCTE